MRNRRLCRHDPLPVAGLLWRLPPSGWCGVCHSDMEQKHLKPLTDCAGFSFAISTLTAVEVYPCAHPPTMYLHSLMYIYMHIHTFMPYVSGSKKDRDLQDIGPGKGGLLIIIRVWLSTGRFAHP